MVDRAHQRGQSLVEMAFVFPFVLLMLAVMLQIVLLAILHIRLHASAVQMASQLALGQPAFAIETTTLASYRSTLSWGIPIPHLYKESLPTWRRYHGVSTASATNCLAVAELTYPLNGRWFASVGIHSSLLHARAALPCEPSGMAEES